MATSEAPRRWCLFTSAGERNSIRLWLDGGAARRWDLVLAYYGDSDAEFAALAAFARHAFREKGGKFQNLKKLITREPQFFAPYSHVFVCDDDIRMSPAQIDAAFAIAETLDVWVAQPAFDPRGKVSHWINCCAAPLWDYRIVNYVENNAPIFRRDKLGAFLAVYDGSLAGWGIEYWYANLFEADRFGRFAVIDKIAVVNPRDEDKGGREIDRLQSTAERRAAWEAVRSRLGLVEYPHKVFSYGKIAAAANSGSPRPMHEFPPQVASLIAWLETHRPAGWREAEAHLRSFDDAMLGLIAVNLARGLGAVREKGEHRFHRLAAPHIAVVQHRAGHPLSDLALSETGARAAAELAIAAEPTFAIAYDEEGAVAGVRFARIAAAPSATAASSDPGAMSIRRNAPCPCGSGRKFKHCHGRPPAER